MHRHPLKLALAVVLALGVVSLLPRPYLQAPGLKMIQGTPGLWNLAEPLGTGVPAPPPEPPATFVDSPMRDVGRIAWRTARRTPRRSRRYDLGYANHSNAPAAHICERRSRAAETSLRACVSQQMWKIVVGFEVEQTDAIPRSQFFAFHGGMVERGKPLG